MAIILLTGGVLAGDHNQPDMRAMYPHALAVIQPTKGHNVTGTFTFDQQANGVRVVARLKGLTPNQKHGAHIHQWGDLTDAVTGLSAGGHYNPQGHQHGLPPNPIRHAGSFGNIQADKNGNAEFELFDDSISIATPYHPIIGRMVVIHAQPDTGEQPAGNAGPRIGWGVIGVVYQTQD